MIERPSYAVSCTRIVSSHVPFRSYLGTAYHHSVVTPTGNEKVACCPRNEIVATTSCGFHAPLLLPLLIKIVALPCHETTSITGTRPFNTTMLYRHQSEGLFLIVTKAVTWRAQALLPVTLMPIL